MRSSTAAISELTQTIDLESKQKADEAAAIQERIYEIFIEKLRQQEENYGSSW